MSRALISTLGLGLDWATPTDTISLEMTVRKGVGTYFYWSAPPLTRNTTDGIGTPRRHAGDMLLMQRLLINGNRT